MYAESVKVDRDQIKQMCKDNGMTVPEMVDKMRLMDGWSCGVTAMYGYLKKGYMPEPIARKMMITIWDGQPPFYYGDDVRTEERTQIIYPSYATDLIQAQFYLNRAIKKMEQLEKALMEVKHANS